MAVKASIVKWEPNRITGPIEAGLKKGLLESGRVIADHVKAKISRPNPLGLSPSLPGEPPKKVTGELLASVFYEVVEHPGGFSANIGANAAHALPLEFGTVHMAQRPFLRSSLREKQDDAFRIILSYLKKS